MGYSLSVKFKNESEQKAMYDFYIANTDIVKRLSEAEGRDYDVNNYNDLNWNNGLSYAPKVKYLLGYDGGSGRPYYFELLLAWMAVKSSYRDKTNQPFIYYDREKMKVHECNGLMLRVDERGIQTYEMSLKMKNEHLSLSFNLFQVKKFDKYAKKVEELFVILEDRWQKHILK